MNDNIKIKRDDLSDGRIIGLLDLHRQEMFKHSPPESVHALDVGALRSQALTFWRADCGEEFAACGAINELNPRSGEVKSMKTVDEHLRKGIARKLLLVLIDEARKRGYESLKLETGTMAAFIPAQALYQSLGFTECGPFGDYFEDVNSVCMKLVL